MKWRGPARCLAFCSWMGKSSSCPTLILPISGTIPSFSQEINKGGLDICSYGQSLAIPRRDVTGKWRWISRETSQQISIRLTDEEVNKWDEGTQSQLLHHSAADDQQAHLKDREKDTNKKQIWEFQVNNWHQEYDCEIANRAAIEGENLSYIKHCIITSTHRPKVKWRWGKLNRIHTHSVNLSAKRNL